MAQLVPLDDIAVFGNYRGDDDDKAGLDLEHVRALAADMTAHGYDDAHPIELSAPDMTGTYYLVAGHHRHAAATLAGLSEIPAVITDLEPGTLDYLTKQVEENVGRKQSNPLQEGRAFSRMIELGATVEDIAARMKHGTKYVQDRLTITTLDPVAQAVAVNRGIRWALAVADLPKNLQVQLMAAITPETSLEAFRIAADKARTAYLESLQAGLFDMSGMELAVQEWSTDLGAYVTDATAQAVAERQGKPQLFGVDDLAVALNVSRATILKRLQRGTIQPDQRVGNTPIWFAATVQELAAR